MRTEWLNFLKKTGKGPHFGSFFCTFPEPLMTTHGGLTLDRVICHHPFPDGHCYLGPDNAHYIKVLRSSRKSPTTDNQLLLLPPLFPGPSFSSSVLSSKVTCSGNFSFAPTSIPIPAEAEMHHVPLLVTPVVVIFSCPHFLGPSLGEETAPERDHITRTHCPSGF